MPFLPGNVNFLASAASSAAKARWTQPVESTPDSLDVTVALKCITSYQLQGTPEGMNELDDEDSAKPLIAAARILASTAEHLRLAGREEPSTWHELQLYSALGHAMYGNFPSARAALSSVPDLFFTSSAMRSVVQLVLVPERRFQIPEVVGKELLNNFWYHWYHCMREVNFSLAESHFNAAIFYFTRIASTAQFDADRALALSIEVALQQANRLAVARLRTSAPEIPDWFVAGTIGAGMLTLLPPQYHLLVRQRIAVQQGNSLLTLPTSTGKTLIAEACMVASAQNNGFSVYVAPYVAIGEQVRQSLLAKAGAHISVKSMFGGFKREAVQGLDRALIVMTPERLDAWLRSAGAEIDRLRLVVFDEIHLVENGSRGARIEGIISRLRLMQPRFPNLQLLGLSAVLAMPERLCRWLNVHPSNLHRVAWRPTARRLAICRSDGRLEWVHGNDSLRPDGLLPDSPISFPAPVPIPNSVRPHRNSAVFEEAASVNVASIAENLLQRLGGPGLVVCPRKADTRLLATAIAEKMQVTQDIEVLDIAEGIEKRYPWLNGLADCIRATVAFHNASIPFDVRRDIELLTRLRKLTFVCATTTLAEGADLPFRWTLLSHWLSGDGTPLKSMTFRNIAGRSGRAGAFAEGDTVIFENLTGPPDAIYGVNMKRQLTSIMFSSAEIVSAAGSGYGVLADDKRGAVVAAIGAQLLAAIRENPKTDNFDEVFVASTYASTDPENQNIANIVSFSLAQLLDVNAAGGPLAEINSPIRLTALGEAANQTGFSPSSVHGLVEYLQQYQGGVDDVALVVEILTRFSLMPEQSSELWKKIVTKPGHRFPFKIGDAADVMRKFIGGNDIRSIFEELPARATSKAQPKNIEKQFDQFVSMTESLFNGYLPWILRALSTLSPFGSEPSKTVEWGVLSNRVERAYSVDDAEDEEQYEN